MYKTTIELITVKETHAIVYRDAVISCRVIEDKINELGLDLEVKYCTGQLP